MTIFGWDASDFDWSGRGPVDLNAARRDGISFVTHKATEGTGTQHRQFGEFVRRARDAGMPFIGAYGVPRSTSPVSRQVDYFLSYVDSQAPWWRTFPGWFWQCDLEHWPYDVVPPSVGVAWCADVRRRTGRQVILYAPEWAYGNSIPGGDPLWASNYVAGGGPYRQLYPGDGSPKWHAYSGRTPVILQYSSSAWIGTQRGCDANAYRGTEADFAALIGATPIEEDDMFNETDRLTMLQNNAMLRQVRRGELDTKAEYLAAAGPTGEAIWDVNGEIGDDRLWPLLRQQQAQIEQLQAEVAALRVSLGGAQATAVALPTQVARDSGAPLRPEE